MNEIKNKIHYRIIEILDFGCSFKLINEEYKESNDDQCNQI